MALSKTRQRESLQLQIQHADYSVKTALGRREQGAFRTAELPEAEAYLARKTAELAAFNERNPVRGGRQFSGGRVEVIICAGCGKRTTSGIDNTNLDLCRACYAEAMYENQHNDEAHDGAMKDCSACGPKYRALLKGSK